MPIYRHNKNTVSKALVLLSYNSVTLTANVSPPATLISIRSLPVQKRTRQCEQLKLALLGTGGSVAQAARGGGGECFASTHQHCTRYARALADAFADAFAVQCMQMQMHSTAQTAQLVVEDVCSS